VSIDFSGNICMKNNDINLSFSRKL